jgi:hypothetical protein
MEPNLSPGRREARSEIAVAALLALGAAVENRHRAHQAWLAAVPIVVVNYVAFRAQLRFWQAHLDPGDAILVSVALESVAVYLAWQAHRALLADDTALRLRLSAYGTALVIGALNYSHYMRPGGRPTVAAVTFGLMSAISPWLWSIHSRRESRDALKARGRIEDHAVRLGVTRRFFHPVLSTRVSSRAAWTGENRPAEAIRLVPGPRWARGPEPDHAAAPQTPPPVTGSREPRRAAVAQRAAHDPGLAAARSETERDMIRELIRSGSPLPPERSLARDPRLSGSESTRRRAARRVLNSAAAGLNGSGGVRDSGS